jgi:RNA polymerase sigma factor (sigma-70 family)
LGPATPLTSRGGDAVRDYDELWRESGPTLWRAVYAFTGGRRDLTDDAVTEAFARAMQHDESIRAPVPWLFRTAFRVAAAELKRGSLAPALTDDRLGREDEQPVEFLDALRAIPPGQRAVLFLHYYADLSVKEVARLQGTTTAAVKVRLVRGRRKLRELLTEEVHDEARTDP